MELSITMNDFWKEKKVLITGHSGFKGSWLSMVLLYLGAEVYGVSDQKKQGIYSELDLGNLIQKEMFLNITSDYVELDQFVNLIKPDIIFHFAAQSLVPYAFKEPRETLETNIIGTFNILDISNKTKNVNSLIISTTDKVYKSPELWNKEEDDIGGREFYSTSKVAAELVIKDFKNLYARDNLAITILRSGNVIGGGDRGKNRLLTDLLYSVVNKSPMLIRSPRGIRPWQDILDSISGYLKAAEYTHINNMSEIFNLNSKPNNKYDVENLIKMYLTIWETDIDLVIDMDNQIYESEILRLDSSKAQKLLNWDPKIDIEKSLKKIVSWEKSSLNKNSILETKKQIEDYFTND
jgi:CDP-glucose 4,6-dehydratase